MENAYLDSPLIDPMTLNPRDYEIIRDGLSLLYDYVKSKKDNSLPDTLGYMDDILTVGHQLNSLRQPTTGNVRLTGLADKRPRQDGSFTCGWCKNRIVGEDMQRHINRCSADSPIHPKNIANALRGIIEDVGTSNPGN